MPVIRIFAAMLFVMLASHVAASDFNAGFAAYERGDYEEALREWRPLAEQGDAHAQYNLGWMYSNGEGVPQDYVTGVHWYGKAAEQGNARAQFRLGWMYVNGVGVPQDYEKAFYWTGKAAEQGDAHAQYNLGVMYYNGEGVPQDYLEAYAWLNLAAAQGATDGAATEKRDRVLEVLTQDQIVAAQERSRELYDRINGSGNQ